MGKSSNNKLGIICVLFERQFEEIGIYSIFKVLKKNLILLYLTIQIHLKRTDQ